MPFCRKSVKNGDDVAQSAAASAALDCLVAPLLSLLTRELFLPTLLLGSLAFNLRIEAFLLGFHPLHLTLRPVRIDLCLCNVWASRQKCDSEKRMFPHYCLLQT
jgi:hypothetical protein